LKVRQNVLRLPARQFQMAFPQRHAMLRFALFLMGVAVGACSSMLLPATLALPSDGHALFERAQEYHRRGRYLEALSFYRDILLNQGTWNAQDTAAAAEAINALRSTYLSDNTTLYPVPSDIRVLLEETDGEVLVHSTDNLTITVPPQNPPLPLPACSAIRISADNSSLLINSTPTGCRSITITAATSLFVNERRYSGTIQVYADRKTTSLVTIVPLELYLEGVLLREVSPQWHEQSLQAQAIAARTYALYHMLRRRQELFDVYSTTSSQAYGGCEHVPASIRAAVAATRGMVLTHNGAVILSLFHANSGGSTEDTQYIWGFQKPYLGGTPDTPTADHPGGTWTCTLSWHDIQKRLQTFGLSVDMDGDILPVEHSPTSRITTIKIANGKHSFFLTGNSFRLIVGPTKIKSTRFTVVKKKDLFIFSGSGYGHGAGMSQWGAYTLAQRGYDYRQILQFYYPGTRIEHIL